MTTKMFCLAAALAVGLLAGGCSEDGDTILITNAAPAPTFGALPATPYTTTAFAADKQAFNELNAGITFDGTAQPDGCRLHTSGLRAFWNNGKAIVMFATETPNGEAVFWASYFNGSAFTAPVKILAADQDVQGAIDVFRDVRVAWFNTSAFTGATSAATTAGRTRNGDALILWHAADADDAANDGDEANDNLYLTYFDASQSGLATANHGFDRWALQVNDGQDTVANTGSDDVTRTFGFVSDGVTGAAFYDNGAQGDEMAFGDAVSYLVIAYVQDVEAQDSTSADISDARLLTKVVNIGVATDTANSRSTLLGTETRVMPPTDAAEFVAGGGTNGNEETSVQPSLRVYNNEVFYTLADQNNAGGAAQDTPLVWNRFDPATGTWLAASLRVNGSDDDPTDTNASGLNQFGNIYGADEGLATTFSSFAAGGSGGTDDVDAFILQTPPAGAAFGAADLAEIDNELDGSGNNDPVTFQGSVIARDGSSILTAFQQDDTAGASDSVTVLFASVFQPVAAGGTRVNMNAGAGAPFTATPAKITNLAAGDALIDFDLNEEGGFRGVQSNRLVYAGWALTDPTGAADEALLAWTATVTLGTVSPTPSLASNGGAAVASGTFDTAATNGNHSIGVDPVGSDRQIQSWDDGNGGSIVVWVQRTATTAGTGADYYEVKIHDGTATQDFGLDDDQLQEIYLEGGTTLPKQPSVAGANASYGGNTLHLFINVPAFGGGTNTNAWRAVRHRSWDKNSTAGTFAAQWSPALASQATLLSDTIETNDATLTGVTDTALGFTAEARHWVWNGESLGVFFATTEPDAMNVNNVPTARTTDLWYAEWNNGSWSTPTQANDHPTMRHIHGFDVASRDRTAVNTRTNAIMSVATDVGGYDSQHHARLIVRLLR